MRLRTREYTDMQLDPTDIKRLKHGNTVHKVISGQRFAIVMKDQAKARRIKKLRAELKELNKS